MVSILFRMLCGWMIGTILSLYIHELGHVMVGIANGWNWNSPGYLNCMTSEIAKYPAADPITDQVKANIPSTELFRRNYASPAIALCPSGIAIIVTLALILIIVIRMVIWVILRVALLFM